MRDKRQRVVPLARRDGLVIEELPDELLIYDLERHKAHCLNKASALVWRNCDGKMSVEQLSRVLQKHLATPVDDDIVWLALNQLRRFHLLKRESNSFGMMKVSRRDLVSKYLPAALALPLILSIPSPTAAQAGSCLPAGAVCTGPGQCCGFCVNAPGGGMVCQTNPP